MLIEPLSLDEAYLDVTENRRGLDSATATAEEIRQRIKEDDRAHRVGGRFLQQVHRQARVRPEQARWPVRHHPGERAGLRRTACRSSGFAWGRVR
jgi:hypothetical protein